MKSLGLLAIMLNEADFVQRWASSIRKIEHVFDRILVIDGGSTDATARMLSDLQLDVEIRPFDGHFANQRNLGGDMLGTDWIFELDADEQIPAPLLGGLRKIAEDAELAGIDVAGIPRLNFIDGILVAGPGHCGLDYQYRLHRSTCKWRGAVHEEITGYRARFELNVIDGHFILHDKTSARHAARNDYYRTLRP